MTEEKINISEEPVREKHRMVDFSHLPEKQLTSLSWPEKFWLTVVTILLLICFIQSIYFQDGI